MSFSVIIATCNRPDRLAKAMTAVGESIQRIASGGQLVVADNGPDRPARQVTEAFALTAPFTVTYIQTAPYSKAAALNAGIAAADGDWLAFTDDDCVPDPDWLASAAVYCQDAGCQIFSGRLQASPVNFKLPCWLPEGSGKGLPWSPAFVDYAPLPGDGQLSATERVPFGANIFVHKQIFERYGGYDEALWNRCGEAALGSEDAEFAMRVRDAGEVIGYCAGALVRHPVYPERTTMRYYLRHIYHAGLREPLFSDPDQPASRLYLTKTMVGSLLRCGGWWLRAKPVRAMDALMNAVRDWGEIRGWIRLAS